MYPNIEECFMCTNNYNCTVVNDKIVTQVEYLLPEITVISRGIPLRICSLCEQTLRTFSIFKEICVENNLRLEAKLNEAQISTNNTAQSYKALDLKCAKPKSRLHKFEEKIKKKQISIASDTQLHSDIFDTKHINSTVDTNTKNVEHISIKENACEKTPNDCTFYNYLLQNTKKENKNVQPGASVLLPLVIMIKDLECNKDGGDKKNGNMTPSTSEQKNTTEPNIPKFEEIYIKQEPAEGTSTDSDNHDVIDNNSSDSNLNCSNDNQQFTANNDTSKIQTGFNIYAGMEFKCSICGKMFTRNTYLKNHVKIVHDGVRDFQCPNCSKKFSQKGDLMRHVKIHAKIKEFQCVICTKKFSRKTTLDAHMKIHTGIKDFQCHICNKMFIQKSNLQTHIKAHHPNN